MKKLFIACSCVIILSGCGANAAKKQLLVATGGFEATQMVMQTRLASPTITEKEKATYKELSQKGTDALDMAKSYLDQGQTDDLTRQMALINGFLQYLRYELYGVSVPQEIPPISTPIVSGESN